MHLFPWTRRRARRQAIAEAQARQRADYDRAVQRIIEQDADELDRASGGVQPEHDDRAGGHVDVRAANGAAAVGAACTRVEGHCAGQDAIGGDDRKHLLRARLTLIAHAFTLRAERP
jgi:hypothetical protein